MSNSKTTSPRDYLASVAIEGKVKLQIHGFRTVLKGVAGEASLKGFAALAGGGPTVQFSSPMSQIGDDRKAAEVFVLSGRAAEVFIRGGKAEGEAKPKTKAEERAAAPPVAAVASNGTQH